MTNDLQVDVRRGPAAFQDLAADWQRLWLAQPRREVFTSRAWCLAAWQADGENAQIVVIAVRRADAVVGLLPLSLSPVRFLSGVNADYNDMLVCDDDAAAVVAVALRAALQRFGGCVFDNVPDWSTLSRVLEQLPQDLRRCIVVEPGQPCPALRLSEDRAALLAAMTGKQSLKRHEKKLARQGALRLWHVEQREQILERLDDFFSQHVARRALAGGRSLFLEPRARDFYRFLLEQFDPACELRFAVLEVDGRAVAYHLGFEVDGRFTWYKPSFDVDYWDCGVGEVLLKRLLEYVRDRPVIEFDFTRGDEAFKDRFSNHQGRNVRWTLQRGTLVVRLTDWRAKARQALRRHPTVTGLRARLNFIDERCRRTPGAGQRLDLARLLRAREQVLVLCAERRRLLAAPLPVDDLVVERCGLRRVATLAVQRGARFDLGDLQRLRESQQAGDLLFVGRDGAATVGVAWVGARNLLSIPSPAFSGHKVELGESSAALQFLGQAWPEGAQLRTMIAVMAAQVPHERVWLVCPAGATDTVRVLVEAGFEPRCRLHAQASFARPWVVRSSAVVAGAA